MAAQRSGKFCLAAALFGFPPADGYAEPTQQVPDSWLGLFEEYADERLRAGLATSCKAGQAYHTPNQVVVSGPDGSKVVTFTIDDSFGSLTSTASLAQAASQHHTDVVEITLRRGPQARRVRLVQAVVDQVLGPFSSTLRSLHIDSALGPLPPPSQLPRLRSLSLSCPQEATTSSLAAHTQLTSLQLDYAEVELPFPLILLPGPTAYALCHLSTTQDLDDELLSLLLQRTPSLTHLTVDRLKLTTDAAVQREWGLVQLQITDDNAADFEVEQLMMLPKQRGGVVLTVTSVLGVCFRDINFEGISSRVLARMPWWRLEVQFVCVMINESWSLDDHFTVLPSVLAQLQQVCDLRSADRMVHVEDVPGTHYITTSLDPTIRPEFRVYESLTDDILRTLLRWSSLDVYQLSMNSLELQSDQHANTAWPWEELSISKPVPLVQLMRLPNPAGRAVMPTVDISHIQLYYEDISQVSVPRITDFFTNIDFANSPTFELVCKEREPTMDLYWLRTVAAAVKLDAHTAKETSLILTGLRVTNSLLQKRSTLPHWGGELVFNMCTFDREAYTWLQQWVPESYSSVRVTPEPVFLRAN